MSRQFSATVIFTSFVKLHNVNIGFIKKNIMPIN